MPNVSPAAASARAARVAERQQRRRQAAATMPAAFQNVAAAIEVKAGVADAVEKAEDMEPVQKVFEHNGVPPPLPLPLPLPSPLQNFATGAGEADLNTDVALVDEVEAAKEVDAAAAAAESLGAWVVLNLPTLATLTALTPDPGNPTAELATFSMPRTLLRGGVSDNLLYHAKAITKPLTLNPKP